MAEALQLRSLPYAKQERKWFGFNSFDSCGIALFKQDFAALRRLHHTTLPRGITDRRSACSTNIRISGAVSLGWRNVSGTGP